MHIFNKEWVKGKREVEDEQAAGEED